MTFYFTSVSVCSKIVGRNWLDGSASTEQSDVLNINDCENGTINCSPVFNVHIRVPFLGGRGNFSQTPFDGYCFLFEYQESVSSVNVAF